MGIQASLEMLLLRHFELGCDFALGGWVTKKLGLKHSLPVVEINTPDEEIRTTFENAKSVAQFNRDEKEKTQRYKQILDNISEGVIAVDRKGEVIIMNRFARDVFKVFSDDGTGELISKYVPLEKVMKILESSHPLLNRIEIINNIRHVFNHIPILMGSKVIGVDRKGVG